MRTKLIAVLAVVAMVATLAVTATAATPVDTEDLRDAVTVGGVRAHQAAFQAAADANGGTRASGTPGYDASADYVADLLEDAGFDVERQVFDFSFFTENSSSLAVDTVAIATQTMSFSGSGIVTAGNVIAVDLDLGLGNSSTSGCEAADFVGPDWSGSDDIALIQRGACAFGLKAINAQAAGAEAVIIFNQGNTTDPGRQDIIGGTLGEGVVGVLTIPVLDTSYSDGLVVLGGTTVDLAADTTIITNTTENVIAELPGGRDDRVVVVGAHLDSVPGGPGIQDNGSGSAAILEIALQMAALGIEPRNQVRFAWWGAEESGLLGSQFYVDGLSKRDIKDIALNLNFDMIGSPNFVRFVYDGDGSDTGASGPNGSGNIEDVFLDYFADEAGGLLTEPTAFDGRSDYGPFIAVGIPAGGLFTGAEGIKTAQQAADYGGIAGEQYDPCYHQACDTFANISTMALDQNSDAAAHAVLTYAMTTSSVKGTDKGSSNSIETVEDLEFKGSRAQR